MEEPRHPVSGIDYPGTFQDFDKWFSSENACLEYIAKLRWPQGFICPSCAEKADKPSLMGCGLFLCRKCKRQTSIKARGLLSYRLMEQALDCRPVPRKMIIDGQT